MPISVHLCSVNPMKKSFSIADAVSLIRSSARPGTTSCSSSMCRILPSASCGTPRITDKMRPINVGPMLVRPSSRQRSRGPSLGALHSRLVVERPQRYRRLEAAHLQNGRTEGVAREGAETRVGPRPKAEMDQHTAGCRDGVEGSRSRLLPALGRCRKHRSVEGSRASPPFRVGHRVTRRHRCTLAGAHGEPPNSY